MSLSSDPHIVTCDGAGTSGAGCRSTARLPVALRPHLTRGDAAAPDGMAITGWLFVTVQGRATRHFCPQCTPGYLAGIIPGALGAAGSERTKRES